MSRRRPDPDRLLLASLDATAGRNALDHTPHDEAIAEIHSITTRADLLSQAAGTHLGVWQDHPSTNPANLDAAQLLIDAGGADIAVILAEAAKVWHALKGYSTWRAGTS